MIEQQNYNTYCTHLECIQAKNAFFVYREDNFHVVSKHKVAILHPLQFNQITKNFQENQKSLLVRDKNSLMQRVNRHIVSLCNKLTEFVRQRYLQQFLTNAQNELNEIKIYSKAQIYSKLTSGDYNLLKQIVRGDTHQNISYPFYQYTQNRFKEIDDKVAKEIQTLYSAIQKILTVTFERKDDFLKVVEGHEEEVSDPAKQQIKKVFKLTESSSSRKSAELQNNAYRLQNSSEDNQNEAYSDDPWFKTKPKKKIIYKPQKKGKNNDRKSDDRKIIKDVDLADQINYVGLGQIKIKSCTSVMATFEHLKEKYKFLNKIHLFDHRFAKKEILRRLFSYYKNIKVLTLNCYHQFDPSIITQYMSKQDIEKIQNLELKWDLGKFFKEYHIFKYFPTKDRSQIQSYKKTTLGLDLLLQMKNNRSLSINSQKQILLLQATPYAFGAVQTLHYTKVHQEKSNNPPFSKLMLLNKFTHLTTLNLIEVSIDSEKDFGEFLKSNKGITTLNLGYCKTSVPINNIFQQLRQLENLKQFSFSTPNQYEQIRPDNVFSLTSLEHLHLSNVNFAINNYENSGGLKDIRNLKNLTYLSLYACNPIFSDLFSHMQKQTLERIEFLNIGYTQIDQNFIKYIPSMTKLQYLNVDSVLISGSSLLSGFRSYYQMNGFVSPLKYLSIEAQMQTETAFNYSVEEMKELSKYIPSLSYLEITQRNSLGGYDFRQFKQLRNLALNESLQKEIPLQNMSSSIKLHIRK